MLNYQRVYSVYSYHIHHVPPFLLVKAPSSLEITEDLRFITDDPNPFLQSPIMVTRHSHLHSATAPQIFCIPSNIRKTLEVQYLPKKVGPIFIIFQA